MHGWENIHQLNFSWIFIQLCLYLMDIPTEVMERFSHLKPEVKKPASWWSANKLNHNRKDTFGICIFEKVLLTHWDISYLNNLVCSRYLAKVAVKVFWQYFTCVCLIFNLLNSTPAVFDLGRIDPLGTVKTPPVPLCLPCYASEK